MMKKSLAHTVGKSLVGLFASTIFVLGVVSGCGLENALVGGACKPGFEVCNERCTDLLADPSHCGACGTACPMGVGCGGGLCGGRANPHGPATDAPIAGAAAPPASDATRDTDPFVTDSATAPTLDGALDASVDDADVDASVDGAAASQADASPRDASHDGSSSDASVGADVDATACPPPPYDTPATCGSCFVSCMAPNSECMNVGGTFTCGPPCPPPQEACHGVCVDLRNDPFNCGVCDKTCPSNICVAGVCQGTTPGHVVVIGHDYSNTFAGSAQTKVLSNAVFLPAKNPLRVLSFEKWADPSTVATVKSMLAAAALGRTLQYTTSNDDADLRSPLKLSRASVVIIYDQRQMSQSEALAAGPRWAAPLHTFNQEGGTIVVLDGTDGLGQMPELLRSARLLDVASHSALTSGSQVTVVAPFDQVGLGVLSPYGVAARSVTFRSNEPAGPHVTFVVRDGLSGLGDPIVVHKLVPPP
jgi:hypothetical protein